MAFLELRNLSKSFDSTPVLRSIDLSVDEGEFVAVVGPSGCGKSTLLRIIAGLEAHEAGEILISGVRVDALPPKARDIAMVFQSYALYPHMTVAQNLAFPLVMRDLSRLERLPLVRRLNHRVAAKYRDIRATIEETAALVELSSLLERKPKQLSGGQQQRVALARALVRQPSLFLLDEPLSNLHAALRASTRTEIVELQRRLGVTTVYVTHDQTEAMTMARRIAVMMDGKIVQMGQAEEIYRLPNDLRVAQFIGMPQMTLLPGDVRGGVIWVAGAQTLGRVAKPASPRVTVGYRAEDIKLADGSTTSLTGILRHVEFLGSEALIHLELTGLPEVAPLIVRVAPDTPMDLAPGTVYGIALDPRNAHVFGADGRRLDFEPLAHAATMSAGVVGGNGA